MEIYKFKFPFRRFSWGIFSLYLGDQALMFALPLIVYKTTGSVTYVGISYLIEWFPRVLFLPIAGVLTDKFRDRFILLSSDFTKIILCIATFILLAHTTQGIAVIGGIISAIISLTNSQTLVAAEALIGRMYSEAEFAKKTATLQSFDQLSMIIGPVFAVGLANFLDIKKFLLIAAAFYFVNFVNLYLLLPRNLTSQSYNESINLVKSLHQSWSLLIKYPRLLTFSAFAAANNLVIGLLEAAGVAIVTGTFGKSDSHFSMMALVAGCVGFTSLAVVPVLLKFMQVKMLGRVAFVALCLAGVSTNIAADFWSFVSSYSAVIGTTLLTSIYLRHERVKIVPTEHLGKVVGLMAALGQSSLPVAGLLLATLSNYVTVQQLGLVATLLLALSGFQVFFFLNFLAQR